jgi:type IV secretory pathway TrbF-like protein
MKAKQRFWSLRIGKQWILVGLLGLSLVAGCATPSQAPYVWTGSGLGAALGAGIGAAANHNNPWRGAAIGGLLGAAGGGVAGAVYGQSQNQYQPQPQGAYQPPQQQGYYQPQQGNYQPAPYYGPPPS